LLIFNKAVAYRFKLGESVPGGIRRIVREEIQSTVSHLSGPGTAHRDEAVHEARRSIKKIRGVLRLIRPDLGEIYRLENSHFRGIGRQLSQFRDADAIIEIFDALRRKYAGKLDRRTLGAMRRRLTVRKAQAEKQGNIGEVLDGLATTLRQSDARVNAWPLSQDGFPAIAPGLEATFRSGQKAMRRARRHPRAVNFHEWRKRVKEHWYHIRLLEDLWNPAMQEYEKSLKDLETALGDEHNLVVLRQQPGIGPLNGLIRKYRGELRDRALALGERIYDAKPSHFTRRVRCLWDEASPSVSKEDGRPKAAVSAPVSGLPVTAGSGNHGGDPTGDHAPPIPRQR
jgi:CHAD domain-containing protein